MPNFEQSPKPDPRREEALREQLANHEEELREVEREIERVKQLQTIRSGFETSKVVVAGFEDSEEAAEQIEAAIAAVKALEEGRNLPALLERRRQVKQLMVTGKMDLDASSGSEQK